MISFVGTAGGRAVDELYTYSSFAFQQLNEKRFDVAFSDDAEVAGSVHLTWQETILDGEQGSVTGDVTLPGEAPMTVQGGSVLTPDGDKKIFSLNFGGADHLDGCVMNVF